MSNPNYSAMQSSNPAQPAPKRYDGRDGGLVYDHTNGGHFGKQTKLALLNGKS